MTVPYFVLWAAASLGLLVIVHAILFADTLMKFLIEISVFPAVIDASMTVPDLSFRAAA